MTPSDSGKDGEQLQLTEITNERQAGTAAFETNLVASHKAKYAFII